MNLDRQHIQLNLRCRVLPTLSEIPETSQRTLADVLGGHWGRIKSTLGSMVAQDLVKIGDFTATDDNRHRAYPLTQAGRRAKAAVTQQHLAHLRFEDEALRAEIKKLEADMNSAGNDALCVRRGNDEKL